MGITCGNTMIDEIMWEVIDVSKKAFGDDLCQIWLFGSQVTNDIDEDSDIDVMVVISYPHEYMKIGYEVYSQFKLDILTKYNEILSILSVGRDYFNTSKSELCEKIRNRGVLYYEK